jgi:hypothetical protein
VIKILYPRLGLQRKTQEGSTGIMQKSKLKIFFFVCITFIRSFICFHSKVSYI